MVAWNEHAFPLAHTDFLDAVVENHLAGEHIIERNITE